MTRGAPRADQQPTPGAPNLRLVGNSHKDGTTNSDLAFNGNLVYSGDYGGFRILDVRGDTPRVVVDHPCNGPQDEVSFSKLGGKPFLFQSIDSGQDREDSSSVTVPIVEGSRVGFDGVRVFDVTNPAKPVFIDMIQAASGFGTVTAGCAENTPPQLQPLEHKRVEPASDPTGSLGNNDGTGATTTTAGAYRLLTGRDQHLRRRQSEPVTARHALRRVVGGAGPIDRFTRIDLAALGAIAYSQESIQDCVFMGEASIYG